MNEKNLKQVFQTIDNMQNEAIKLMSDLISLNTVGPKNGGPGEQAKADYLVEYLKQNGITQITNYPAADPNAEKGERPNLIIKIPGKDDSKTLWIMAHTDVVPPGDLTKWGSDPFKAEVKDGKIFGRGSEDNLQGLVSAVIMVRALMESNIQPAVNIGLVFVADEETGSDFGLGHVLKNHAELFNLNDLIVIPDAGESDSSMIEVAEKSIVWFKFKTFGKQVHASTPDRGINAFKAAIFLAHELDSLYKIYDHSDPVFDPPISTFEPTRKEANVPNVNTIPGEDVFYLDCRILPEYDIKQVTNTVKEIVKKIEKKFSVKIEISTEQDEQAAPATPTDAQIVKMLSKAIKTVYGIEAKPQGIGGGTVAAIFRRKGFKAAVWSTIDDLAHQPNEYCKIKNLLGDAKVFAHCALEAE